MHSSSRSRARVLSAAAVLPAAALLLGSCSQDQDSESDGGGGHYPVTVNSCGEDVTFEQEPERIVLLKSASVPGLHELGVLDRVEAEIRTINPLAKLHRTQNCAVPLEAVLERNAFDLDRILDVEPDFLEEGHHHHHDSDIRSISARMRPRLNPVASNNSWMAFGSIFNSSFSRRF